MWASGKEYLMVRKGMFMYDALLHVPMIWYAPGRISAGLSLDMPTQNLLVFVATALGLALIPEFIARFSAAGQRTTAILQPSRTSCGKPARYQG